MKEKTPVMSREVADSELNRGGGRDRYTQQSGLLSERIYAGLCEQHHVALGLPLRVYIIAIS